MSPSKTITTDPTIAEWADTPPGPEGTGRPRFYAGLFDEIRKRAGWARVELPGATQKQIVGFAGGTNAGKYAGITKGEFTATTRLIDGKMTVWVKHNGEPTEQPS